MEAEKRQMLLACAWEIMRKELIQPAEPFVFPDDPGLDEPAGCFVSLHACAGHRLRGCIGTMSARQAIRQSLEFAARSVLRDPRFVNDPVTLAELPALEVEITLLGPLRLAGSPDDFDLLNEGVYVTIGGRSGCFLPQVARETGWTRAQLLDRLCTEKLGMAADAWKNPDAVIEAFSAEVIA